MRLMGLDVGTKTVGIALSDPLQMTAQPHSTLRYQSEGEAHKKILLLIRLEEVETIVAGLPLNMHGTEGPQAAFVRKFIESLKKSPAAAKTNVIFWDERLSSVGAERALLEADLSRAKRKKVIDKMAAVFILQGYLDSRQRPWE